MNIYSLRKEGIRIKEKDDVLLWPLNNTTGNVYAKSAYNEIKTKHYNYVSKWLYARLWKWNFTLKIKCFLWLNFINCLLTWDNLLHKGWP